MSSRRFNFTSRRTLIDFTSIGLADSLRHLGRYNLRQAKAGLSEHVHKGAMEICYLAKGRQVYRVGGRDYVVGGNDIFVTFPDETHSTGRHPEEKGNLYWLILNIPRKNKKFLGFDSAQARPLLDRLLGMPRRCFQASGKIQDLLDAIFAAYFQAPPELKRILVTSRVLEFLVAVADYAYNPLEDRTAEDINSVLAFIDTHPDISMSVPELAERMNLSESWFKAKFRRHVGLPPAEYILRKKIEHARQMLISQDKTITQIAFELGFSSSGYFATVFRRFTGKSPRDVREQ